MIRKILYLFAFAMLLTGCMVGPKFQKPVVESPVTFMYDSLLGDSTINIAWWELFQDEQLDTLVKTALVNNRNVLQAASRIEEARSFLGYSQADLLPSLGYDGNLGLPDNSIVSPAGSFLTAGILWELDFWGKFRRANEAARAELLASQYSQQWIYVNLISEVASTYFTYLDFKQRNDITIRTLKSRQESLRIIQARFDKGVVPELDLNQAEIQEASAASAVPFYERSMAVSENTLSILIGSNPQKLLIGRSLEEVHPPAEIPVGVPSEILSRRPDILEAEQILKAQNARIGVAQAMRFPSISLTGLFGSVSPELGSLLSSESLGWSAAAGITGPIFNFGKNKRRVEVERYRTEQALFGYEQSILLALGDVEDALVGVHTYKKEVEALNRQRSSATNATMLSRERYDGGITSYLEVLDSERTLFNAEIQASQSYRNQLINYIRLYKSLGGGWIRPE